MPAPFFVSPDVNTALRVANKAALAVAVVDGQTVAPSVVNATTVTIGSSTTWSNNAIFSYGNSTASANHRTALGLGTLATQNGTIADLEAQDLACVTLTRPSGVVLPFVSSANTSVARMAALRAALEAAQLTPSESCVVTLIKGDFTVATGAPLATYNPALNVTLEFGEGTTILYQTPENASSDVTFFPPGPRRLKWFGLAGNPAVSDLPAIKAARFSMTTFDSPENEFGEVARAGTLEFDGNLAHVNDSVPMSMYQTFQNGGISAMANFAPAAGSEKFIVDVACRSALLDANYTHDVRILNFYITAHATGNEKASALRFAGAQLSEIDLKYFNIALRGVVFKPTTTFVRIIRLDGGGNLGPGLEMVDCNLITLDQVSFNGVNNLGTEIRDTRFSPAIWMENCRGITAHTILVESSAHGVAIKDSYSVDLSYVEIPVVGLPGGFSGNPIGVTIENSGQVKVSGRAKTGNGNIMIQDLSSKFELKNTSNNLQSFSYNQSDIFRQLVIHSNLDFTKPNKAYIAFTRPESDIPTTTVGYHLDSPNAAANPGFAISSINDTGVRREMVNLAMAHGANYAGYTGIWDSDGDGGQYFAGKVNTQTAYRVNLEQVVGARQTGWTTMTGTATTLAGAFDTSTVTLQQLAQVVKALIDAGITHGLIGPTPP